MSWAPNRELEEENTDHRLTHGFWLAKDNRFLTPKSSYERILTAPPYRLFIHVVPVLFLSCLWFLGRYGGLFSFWLSNVCLLLDLPSDRQFRLRKKKIMWRRKRKKQPILRRFLMLIGCGLEGQGTEDCWNCRFLTSCVGEGTLAQLFMSRKEEESRKQIPERLWKRLKLQKLRKKTIT